MRGKKRKSERGCEEGMGREQGDAGPPLKTAGARVNEEPLIKIRSVSFGIVEIGTNGPLALSPPLALPLARECTSSHIKCGYITSRAESNARYILFARRGNLWVSRAGARAQGNRLRSFMQIRESNARADGAVGFRSDGEKGWEGHG